MAEERGGGTYLLKVIERLKADKFRCMENVLCEDRTFACVARRGGPSLTKFSYTETVFIFERFASLDLYSLRNFSSSGYRCAIENRRVPLPLGYGATVYCFSVALIDNVDPGVAEVVKNEVPPTHVGSAQVPVIYDVAENSIYYLEETPVWGFVYYAGFRKMIRRLLAP